MFLTWLAVALLHPDVAVVLCHAGLRVQEGHAHTALGTESGIVAATVFNGLPVELVTQPEHRSDRETGKEGKEQVIRPEGTQREKNPLWFV